MMEDNEFSTNHKINCVIHWYQTWNNNQRGLFLNDLIENSAPYKLDVLLTAMDGMKINESTRSVFNYQMQLYKRWFKRFTEAEKNSFLVRLESLDPGAISSLHQQPEGGAPAHR